MDQRDPCMYLQKFNGWGDNCWPQNSLQRNVVKLEKFYTINYIHMLVSTDQHITDWEKNNNITSSGYVN